nr:hypothetical protein [Desulfobacula sp.]
MINISELNERGWVTVDDISSKEDLFELGRTIGTPVLTPNGEYVKEIRRFSAAQAQPESQSALYGTGRFPLHSDTVFWATPIKYVLLRGYGDTRRPTTVLTFEDLFSDCDDHFMSLFRKSIWRVRTGKNQFYCSPIFYCGDSKGWRLDVDLMHPANISAKQIAPRLRELVSRADTHNLNWNDNTAAIILNWTTLHGRGAQPDNEGERVIERLYVR